MMPTTNFSEGPAVCPAGPIQGQTGGASCDKCCMCEAMDDVLSWRNPVTSGCALAAVNLTFFLLCFVGYSLVSVICYTGMLVLGLGFLSSAFLGRVDGGENVEVFSKADVEKHLISIYDKVNNAATKARRIVLWTDRWSSLKICGALFATAYVAAWFSLPTLLFIVSNLMFAKTFVCDLYKQHAQTYVHKAKEALTNCYQQIPKTKDLKRVQ